MNLFYCCLQTQPFPHQIKKAIKQHVQGLRPRPYCLIAQFCLCSSRIEARSLFSCWLTLPQNHVPCQFGHHLANIKRITDLTFSSDKSMYFTRPSLHVTMSHSDILCRIMSRRAFMPAFASSYLCCRFSSSYSKLCTNLSLTSGAMRRAR